MLLMCSSVDWSDLKVGQLKLHKHICKKNIHTHEIIHKIQVIRAKLVVFAYDSNRLEAEAG